MFALRSRRALIGVIIAVPAGLAFAALGFMVATWGLHQMWESVYALSYPQALAVAAALWCVRWVGRLIVNVVPPGARTQRMGGTDGTEPVHYNGWHRPLTVILTHTTNTYLRPHLPVRGLLMVHEMSTNNFAQPRQVTFQRLARDGKPLGGPVHVDDAAFSYIPPDRTA